MSLGTLLLIVVLFLLINGRFGWVGPGPWYGGNPQYVGGGLGTVLVVLLVLWLLGILR
jgi:hypothetical protein